MNAAVHRVLASAVSIATIAGCGGTDPTEPRAVREQDPVGAVPEQVPDEQESASPTRGLACAAQRGEVRLCGASTDNYKASFNPDPDAPERRTWLAVNELELDGRRYEVVAGQPLQPEAVRLAPVDGEGGDEIEVSAKLIEGPATVALRAGPQLGLWGPLLTLEDDQVPAGETVVVELRVLDGGEDATVRLEYVRDDQLADASEPSREHGGPGGRWSVDGMPTATNLELGWE